MTNDLGELLRIYTAAELRHDHTPSAETRKRLLAAEQAVCDRLVSTRGIEGITCEVVVVEGRTFRFFRCEFALPNVRPSANPHPGWQHGGSLLAIGSGDLPAKIARQVVKHMRGGEL